MKRLIFGIIFFCFTLSTLSIVAAEQAQEKPLTLFDCYQLALRQSEIIAIDSEVIKEAEARFLQAFAGVLPHVTFSTSKSYTDVKSEATSLFPRDSTEQKFVFTQNIFSGFKELAAMAGSRHEKTQRIAEKKRAEQLLFVDVSDSFYLLTEEREDLNILQSIKAVLLGRIHDLEKRVQLGRSRRSEIVYTEAQYYGVAAEIELVKSQEIIARQLLEFLTGKPVGEITDEDNSLPALDSEAVYLAKAIFRPDVKAASEAWEVAKKQVTVARADFLPNVSITGDYYTYRTTLPTDSRWDALISVNVPIFEGTQTYGAVKQANAQTREKELLFLRTTRIAKQDIRNSYVQLSAAISRNKALKKVLVTNEMNYFLQKQDYQFSLVNNLDVLAAIQSLEQARRTYKQNFYDTKRFYWQLQIATGETP